MDLVAREDGTLAGSRLGWLWLLLPIIFLPNLAQPFSELFRGHPTPLRLGLVLTGVTAFIALYLWTCLNNDVSRPTYPAVAPARSTLWLWGPVIGLVGLSIAVILGDGPRWLSLLIFTSAAAGGRLSLGSATRVVGLMALLAALLGWLAHDTVTDLGPSAFWTGMAGVLTIIINHFRRTNRAMRTAREEIARLAVETERLRFARDLHDLLGHNLARIALQSEVAEALVPSAPEQAMAAMREVADAARTALQEVRAAVAGYRQPTLLHEIRGAREILSAAGIAFRHEGERTAAPPAVEAVLAWAVREGVTNIIKHSRAMHCTVRVDRTGDTVQLEILDDGAGVANSRWDGASGGSGLEGLRERAAALGGRCEPGRIDGGFRLRVSLPVGDGGGARTADRAPEQTLAGAGTGDRA
ncbi:MAG TPA: sensor histidine kinase [Chloroflexota bacterium]|nr:sensor histidine kinase [Chloroflexota bacterium]